MCGGKGEHGVTLKSVERFDLRVGEWENVAPTLSSRVYAGSAMLKGEVYLAGGWNETVEM